MQEEEKNAQEKTTEALENVEEDMRQRRVQEITGKSVDSESIEKTLNDDEGEESEADENDA